MHWLDWYLDIKLGKLSLKSLHGLTIVPDLREPYLL